MRKRKVWRVRPADPALLYIFQHDLKVSPVLARLLANRGIATVEEARLFLEGGLEEMHDPFLMADMERAVSRVVRALENREQILVYGDYDADGSTATALLVRVLAGLGGQVGYYIPNRLEDGYGIHLEALSRAAGEGYGLVVTVDCGISALDEIEENRAAGGPEVVITDHHEPPGELPGAVAVVNPKRADCPYPFKELAGVGVALKLAQAVLIQLGRDPAAWTEHLDLACLGTVADIVPLHGENRIIVKHGLPALLNTGSPGLRALMEVSGIKPDHLDTREVGFALAPRLNAAGRVGDASKAVELLLTTDPGEAAGLAQLLHRGNQERQRIESLVLAEAMGMLDADPGLAGGRVIVLASPNWHQGVVGIVASRLADRYYRPVLLIALEGEEGKGSGRSIPGFHLYSAVNSCGDLLTRFGGHAQAVGFSIPAARVDLLRRAINEYAEKYIPEEAFVPGMDLDASVSLGEITDGLVEEINQLAPFGHCNPGPLLACREATLLSCREIGKNGGHLKMVIREKGAVLDAIAFKQASCLDEIAAAREVDLAFLPSINQWAGRRSLQLEVKDIRPSGADWEDQTAAARSPEEAAGCAGPLESLERLGPLALLPEFVPAALIRYRAESPHFFFPDGYLGFFSPAGGAGEGQSRQGLRMLKEPEQRCFRLKALAARGGGCLVLVSEPARAVELAIYLNRSGTPAAFMHQGVLPGEVSTLREGFASGSPAALVCTYGALGRIDVRPQRVILFGLPGRPGDLDQAAAGGVSCHTLFGQNDLRAGRECLAAVAPDRRRLLEIYQLIRSGGSEYIDPERVAEQLRQRGLVRAGPHTVAFGLAVFADLGLLQCSGAGAGYRVVHNGSRDKRDLLDSAIFRAGQDFAGSTEKWWGSLLAGTEAGAAGDF